MLSNHSKSFQEVQFGSLLCPCEIGVPRLLLGSDSISTRGAFHSACVFVLIRGCLSRFAIFSFCFAYIYIYLCPSLFTFFSLNLLI